MATENLVFIFTLNNKFEGLDEPVLLITENPLTISNNVGDSITAPVLTISKIIRLAKQEPMESLQNDIIISTGFIIIYNENSDNKGLLTTGNIKINNNKLIFTSNLEVIDISKIMMKGILEVAPDNFLENMKTLKYNLTELKKKPKVSKNINVVDDNEDDNDIIILFKKVITEFISITEKILNISNFKKFISFDKDNYEEVIQKVNNDASKRVNLQTLLKYYNDNKVDVESVWKNVDFSGFKDYDGKSIRENSSNIQSVYQDLVYTDNNILNNQVKTDEDMDIFFKSDSHKGKNNDYQVILKRLTEYLYRFKNKKTMFLGDNNQKYETMQFLYTVISKHYEKLKKFVDSDILTDINGETQPDMKLPQGINIMIRNIMKTNILTFLKIRNDQHNDKSYNKRMDIQVNKDGNPKHLLLQYNDDNMQYYEKVDDKTFKSKITEYDDKFGQDGLDFKVNKYDKQYVFGEFTQIFTPELDNREIAEKMTIIRNNLLSDNPKPVFLMGYGASGAGKTSTLIYFNKEKMDGILINLCNQVGSSYENMEVQYREFYDSDMCNLKNEKKIECKAKDDDSGKGRTYKKDPVGKDERNAIFEYTNNQYTLKSDFTHTHHHEFRIKKLHEEEKREKERELKKGNPIEQDINKEENISTHTTTFNKGATLGELMIYLIDTDRHVKATTNNPNSSRSHSLIFVKFTDAKKSKPAYLIVGDFAGVENEFDCDNPKVKEEFMKIKSDKKDKDGNSYAFYKAEYDNGIIDPIGPLQQIPQRGGVEVAYEKDDNLPMIAPDNLENNFNINKSEWLKDERYKVLENFDATSYNIFAKMFIKSDNKEYNKLDDNEYNKLKNSFYNYRAVAQLKPYSDSATYPTGENTYETPEIKAFREAFSRYLSSSNNLLSNNQKNIEYDKLKNIITERANNFFVNDRAHTYINAKMIYIDLKNLLTNGYTYNDKSENFIYYNKEEILDTLYTYLDKTLGVFNQRDEKNMSKEYKIKGFYKTNNEERNKIPVRFKKGTGKDTEGKDFYTNNLINLLIGSPVVNNSISSDKTNVQDKYTKIKESAYLLLEKLGINTNYDKYFISISKVQSQKIFYEPGPANDLTKELNITGKNIVDLMHSHVFGETENPNSLKQFIYNMIDSRNRRLEIGNVVCAHRRTEGYFINDSLKQIRGVIRDLLYEKNKDALGVVPNYVDICFDKYCPTHENCFAFDSKISKPSNDSEINSVIFQQIYDYLKTTKGDSYTVEQMYKEILVGVFCVINISKGANNPPPVPYVDINDLKRLVYFHSAEDILGSQSGKGDKTDEFLVLATQLIHIIENKYIDEIDGQDKNKIKDIQEALSHINDDYPFHLKIGYDNKENIKKYSFTLFKMVVYHLFKNYNKVMKGGDGELKDRKKLFELDLLRLFILKDWAEVEKRKKLNPHEYGKVEFIDNFSTKFKYKPDIDKYIIKEHRYFVNLYDNLFHQSENQIKYADLKYDYNVMADNIRNEINKHENKLATNHKITIFADNDKNKIVPEGSISPMEMISLAIDEIKTVIKTVNITVGIEDELLKINNPENKNADNFNKIKISINTELENKIKNENKEIINQIKEPGKLVISGELTDKLGKVLENKQAKQNIKMDPNFMNDLNKMLENKENLQKRAIIDEKRKIIENALIENIKNIDEEIEHNIDEIIEKNNLDKVKRELDNVKAVKVNSFNTEKSVIEFEMEGFDDTKLNLNLIEMIRTSSSVMDHIKEFLEIVENSNAISMVGTLEFTDKMAKLNTVATICNEGGDNLFDNFKKTFETKPLYEVKIGGRNLKRNAKTLKTASRKIKSSKTSKSSSRKIKKA